MIRPVRPPIVNAPWSRKSRGRCRYLRAARADLRVIANIVETTATESNRSIGRLGPPSRAGADPDPVSVEGSLAIGPAVSPWNSSNGGSVATGTTTASSAIGGVVAVVPSTVWTTACADTGVGDATGLADATGVADAKGVADATGVVDAVWVSWAVGAGVSSTTFTVLHTTGGALCLSTELSELRLVPLALRP